MLSWKTMTTKLTMTDFILIKQDVIQNWFILTIKSQGLLRTCCTCCSVILIHCVELKVMNWTENCWNFQQKRCKSSLYSQGIPTYGVMPFCWQVWESFKKNAVFKKILLCSLCVISPFLIMTSVVLSTMPARRSVPFVPACLTCFSIHFFPTLMLIFFGVASFVFFFLACFAFILFFFTPVLLFPHLPLSPSLSARLHRRLQLLRLGWDSIFVQHRPSAL